MPRLPLSAPRSHTNLIPSPLPHTALGLPSAPHLERGCCKSQSPSAADSECRPASDSFMCSPIPPDCPATSASCTAACADSGSRSPAPLVSCTPSCNRCAVALPAAPVSCTAACTPSCKRCPVSPSARPASCAAPCTTPCSRSPGATNAPRRILPMQQGLQMKAACCLCACAVQWEEGGVQRSRSVVRGRQCTHPQSSWGCI